MMFSVNRNQIKPARALRGIALAVALFIAVAESHEALLHLWQIAAHASTTPSHTPGIPDQRQNRGSHSCAFCVLLTTPALASPLSVAPLPYADERAAEPMLQLPPVVRDTACLIHFRRGPPALLAA